jgi:hypothetical protein
MLPLFTMAAHAQLRYSTGGVSNYGACNLSPDLPLSVPEAADFRTWYDFAGFTNVTRWENGDVWGSDFRDGTDLDAGGGSDIAQVYFFSGHGVCASPPPTPTDQDFIVTCGNFGKPDFTVIGDSSVWGNNGGTLQFMFVDASCPMKLSSMANQWLPPFQGLHMATGHSGDTGHDTLDSETRGSQFAVNTAGFGFFFPQEPVGQAWMDAGLIDVQSQVCAVATAAGVDLDDANNRLDNEFITSGWPNPTPTTWIAFEWVCAP